VHGLQRHRSSEPWRGRYQMDPNAQYATHQSDGNQIRQRRCRNRLRRCDHSGGNTQSSDQGPWFVWYPQSPEHRATGHESASHIVVPCCDSSTHTFCDHRRDHQRLRQVRTGTASALSRDGRLDSLGCRSSVAPPKRRTTPVGQRLRLRRASSGIDRVANNFGERGNCLPARRTEIIDTNPVIGPQSDKA
jgi:hypothetical protein